MMRPYIDSWLWLPRPLESEVLRVKRELTVRPKKLGEEQPAPIPMFDESRPGYFGVPIEWGFKYLPAHMTVENRTSQGHPVSFTKRPDPNHPQAAPGQAAFMDNLAALVEDQHGTLAVSGTGTGKTVTSLEVIARRGRTAVIIVPLKRLLKQWADECKDKLGCTDADIGFISGDQCDYRGKKIVIAVMKSIAMRLYEPGLYQYFGTCVFDEVHLAGAQVMRQALGRFNAERSWALTATLERRDGADRVYRLFYGGVTVRSEQQAEAMDLFPFNHLTTGKIWGNTPGALNQCLSRDWKRNERIVDKLMKRGSDEKRPTLAIGALIDHGFDIRARLMKRGVPSEQIGMYMGQHVAEDGSRYVPEDKYYDWCKEVPRFIIGTYGSMKLAVDIPRLSAGLDLTPEGTGLQAWGRVRRRLPGKPKSVWDTPVDVASTRCIRLFERRLAECQTDPTIRVLRDGD